MAKSSKKKKNDAHTESIAAVDVGVMHHKHAEIPQQVRVFDLVLGFTGAGIDLYYDASGVFDVPNRTQDWAEFDTWLIAYLQSNNPAPYRTRFDDPASRPHKPRNELSLFAPHENMRGHGIERVFYLIRLRNKQGNGGDDPDRFRYSTISDPFSYSIVDVPHNGADKVFTNPRFIYPGTVVPAEHYERPPSNRYSVTTEAGFMFDCSEISDPHLFEKRFNINVEVASRHKQYSQDRFRPFIPIIIDPDIGHPGGNNTGP